MSEKRLDAKNRWRNVVVAFRMSPEEAQELNVKVSLSGLSKQDYIIQCLLKHEIRVVGGMKVAKKVQVQHYWYDRWVMVNMKSSPVTEGDMRHNLLVLKRFRLLSEIWIKIQLSVRW